MKSEKKFQRLKKRALKNLPKKGRTIPEFQDILGIDELSVMVLISELENEGKLQLLGFAKGYEPDGCAFYLARYGAPS